MSQRILVIEDNSIVRKLLRVTLAIAGFQVLEAENGTEALALAAEGLPDLILQDMMLPDMNGFELVERLRSLPGLTEVPIIACSGFLSQLEYGRAASAGFDDFLAKPVEPDRLVQAVRSHLPEVSVPASPVNLEGLRLLVVDDDPVQLKLARILLSNLGCAVLTARDGTEALEILGREPVDAVMSDVLMPGVDGFRLCARVRADPALNHLPLVLVSSHYLEEDDRRLAEKMGADDLVLRTPDLAQPIAALQAALGNQQPRSSPSAHAGEHFERIRRQLDRQIRLNAAYSCRNSTHASILSVVAGIGESLAQRHSLTGALPDILISLLEAGGVSRGALFLLNQNERGEGTVLGFPPPDDPVWDEWALLKQAARSRQPVVVTASQAGWLEGMGCDCALLVPLVAQGDSLGMLVLGTQRRDLTDPDWAAFARTVSVQIGQALALNRAFAQLEASEDSYRQLLAHAHDCIFTLDDQARLLSVNPAMERFLARPRGDLLRSHLTRFLALGETLDPSTPHGRIRFALPDGRTVTGEITLSPGSSANDALTLGILRDVTERERAEAEVRLLQLVTVAASQATDLKSAFEVVVRLVCQTVGWSFGAAWAPDASAERLLCAGWWSLRPHLQPLLQPAFARGEGVLGRAWSSAQSQWVADLSQEAGCSRRSAAAALGLRAGLAVPVTDQGKVLAVLEFFGDSTGADERFVGLVNAVAVQISEIIARKRTESALRVSETRYKRLAESGIVSIAVADLSGRVLEANDACLAMLGFTAADLQAGRLNWVEQTPPEWREIEADAVASLQTTGVAGPWEQEQFRQDGSRVPVVISVAMLDSTRCIAILSDLSERKSSEKARRAADAAGRLKGEFLAHMSHEIRTPLNGVLGLTYLALTSPSAEHQREYLESIHESGQDLLRIVNDILDFSKIDAGRLSLEKIEFGLHDVINKVTRLQAKKAADKGLQLIVQISPEVPELVVGDPTRLGQVLDNLISNAIKFTDSGEVRVCVEREGAAAGPVDLRFSVQDTGIGMTADQVELLFQPFSQGDSSVSRKYGGTGLGLAICQRLAELLNGEIQVQSEPGQGSTFTFRSRFEGLDDGPRPSAFADFDRALVVGGADTADLCAMLESLRVEVTRRATEAEGSQELSAVAPPYGLVFVAVSEDGAQVAARLRQACTPQKDRVGIILVAESWPVRSPAPGYDAVLVKPFTASQVMDTLTVLQDRSRRPRLEPRQFAESLARSRGRRVLVVEDGAVNRRIVQELLERAGLRVELANDGQEGLERILAGEPVDLVLMDVQMPRMDGYTATAIIRQDPRFRQLPILAMTAHVLPEERERCRAAGMNDYIAKPIDPRLMFATLGRWLPVALPPSDEADFPPIEGLDTPGGLLRVAGNTRLYRDLLLSFARESAQVTAELESALALDDPAPAARLAHMLKGMAANLGMASVARLAAELEGGAADSGPLVQQLAEMSERILVALEESAPAASGSRATLDFVGARAALADMECLLQHSDGSALASLDVVLARVGPCLPPGTLDSLARQVRSYDFAAALDDLARVRQNLTVASGYR